MKKEKSVNLINAFALCGHKTQGKIVMCVSQNDDPTVAQRNRLFFAYKVICEESKGPLCNFGNDKYGPGVNIARHFISTQHKGPSVYHDYSLDNSLFEKGLHVCRTKRYAERQWMENHRVMIKVWIDPKDVITADHKEIAVSKLTIEEMDWVNAGLTPQKPRTRYI